MLMALRATSVDENFAAIDNKEEDGGNWGKERNDRKVILVDRPESKLVWPT